MRFRINLASTPYENARRFFFQWGLALAALLFVSALLLFAAARSWRASHVLSRSISEERARLDKLNEEEKADIAILDRAQNRDVRERSQALNALIIRKSFSWTRIFNDLEKMMPTRLHVVSITPQLNQDDQIEIRMVVAGDSRDKAIELVQNMEKAPDFRLAQILSENSVVAGKGQPTDTVTFNITAQYVPTAAAIMSETEKRATTSRASEAAKSEEKDSKAASPAGGRNPAGRRPVKGGPR